jgi:hypothetical protein
MITCALRILARCCEAGVQNLRPLELREHRPATDAVVMIPSLARLGVGAPLKSDSLLHCTGKIEAPLMELLV